MLFRSVLLTTHYIEEAERLCDEVAILDEGRLLTVASPEELMDRGTDRIVVSLRDPPATAPDVLAGDDRVETVTTEGDDLVVAAGQGGLVAPDLVRALDRRGFAIVDLEIKRTSLEEVFVEMTRTDHTDGDDATETPLATDGGPAPGSGGDRRC